MTLPTDDLLADFLIEGRERVDRMEEALLACAAGAAAPELLEEMRRELHTLKGNSGLMGFAELQALAHALEESLEEADLGSAGRAAEVAGLLAGVDRFRRLLERADPAAPAAGAQPNELHLEGSLEAQQTSVRIGFATLDALVDRLGEVVVLRNRLEDSMAAARPLAAAAAGALWEPFDRAHEDLATALDHLQADVLRLRMVPLQALFRRLGRIVHDHGAASGKEVRLVIAGGDAPLDKSLLELAGDALGHLVRNAVVHGIEGPEERTRAGKERLGTIRLTAEVTAREVRIDVEDDGGGIDREAVAAAALRQGHRQALGQDVFDLLFVAGVTTRAGADLSAGRGIGLAAVRQAVERHGGRVQVASHRGRGTRFRLSLPLSATITRALLLRSDGEDYALPLSAVVESLRFAAGEIHEVNGAGVLRWRGRALATLDVGLSFGTATSRRSAGYAVVIEDRGRHRALVADAVMGIRDIVVKGLDRLAGPPAGIGGATVLGDGRTALILDPAGLLGLAPFAPLAAGAHG